MDVDIIPQEVIPQDSKCFFEYGKVHLEANDFQTRQASIRICMPCCLFQAVTPSLLGGGLIDEFKLLEPMAVWIPSFSEESLSSVADKIIDNPLARVNMSLKTRAEEILQTFKICAHLVSNPSSLIPILPLGIYITLRFRCKVDNIPNVLIGIQNTDIDGVHEFQWALATVLAYILEDFRSRDYLEAP
jgi:hypothetical protein